RPRVGPSASVMIDAKWSNQSSTEPSWQVVFPRKLGALHRNPQGRSGMVSTATTETQVVKLDAHSIEPIPEADKDSTGPQQMWIWAGANIAPINWALGALGIVLNLGLWETIAVIVVGNLVGCAIFSAFTVMGHKTGVNQMVL